jgi:hypothetical protein
MMQYYESDQKLLSPLLFPENQDNDILNVHSLTQQKLIRAEQPNEIGWRTK